MKAENIYNAYVFASALSSEVPLSVGIENHVFTGTTSDGFLTSHSSRSMSFILSKTIVLLMFLWHLLSRLW